METAFELTFYSYSCSREQLYIGWTATALCTKVGSMSNIFYPEYMGQSHPLFYFILTLRCKLFIKFIYLGQRNISMTICVLLFGYTTLFNSVTILKLILQHHTYIHFRPCTTQGMKLARVRVPEAPGFRLGPTGIRGRGPGRPPGFLLSFLYKIVGPPGNLGAPGKFSFFPPLTTYQLLF